MPSPSLNSPQRHGESRRRRAIAMYLNGKTLDDVMSVLGIKRATAHFYLWEARNIAKREDADLLS